LPEITGCGGEWGSGENMRKQFKNTKTEKAKWVEAEKILCGIEGLGYEVDRLIEDTNQKPKQWTAIFLRRKKEKSYLREIGDIVDVIGALNYQYKYVDEYILSKRRRGWVAVFTKRVKK
jgi:hypothetical protein